MNEKRVFRVHELLYCPYYDTGVPETIREEKKEIGDIIHKKIEDYFTKRFDYYEAEKELVLEREKYVLVGHADLINHKDKLVLEIKPHLGRDVRHIYQLSAYVAMYNAIHGTNYYGAFLVYRYNKQRNTVSWSIVKPFYLVNYILDILDRVAEKIMETGERRIATMMCSRCIHRDKCRPTVRIKHNNGFIEVE